MKRGRVFTFNNRPVPDAVDFMGPRPTIFRGVLEPLVEVAHEAALHNFVKRYLWDVFSEGFGAGTTLQVFLKNAVYDLNSLLSEGVKHIGSILLVDISQSGSLCHIVQLLEYVNPLGGAVVYRGQDFGHLESPVRIQSVQNHATEKGVRSVALYDLRFVL